MWRVSLHLVGLLFLTPAVAGVPDTILGSEEDVMKRGGEPAASGVPAPPDPSIDLPKVYLKTAKKARAAYFSLRGGWSQRNYRLTSSGVNANLPGASGYDIEGNVEAEVGDNQKIGVSFLWGSHAFSGLSSFSPASFRINSMQAAIQYGFLIGGEAVPGASSWWLWAGYQAKKRTGQAGLPVSPMTDLYFHGLRVGMSYEGATAVGGFSLSASTYLMLPILFREDVETTGSYRFGLTSESSFMVRYGLREALSIALGGRFFLDYRTYFGTGTRKTVNATELEPVISIPIEIQLRF